MWKHHMLKLQIVEAEEYYMFSVIMTALAEKLGWNYTTFLHEILTKAIRQEKKNVCHFLKKTHLHRNSN